MPALNVLHPGLLRVPDAQWASNTSASASSTSCSSSICLDELSKGSDFTDLTLVTPLASLDSIFGDDLDLQTVPRFSDPTREGLSDKRWRQYSLLAQARFAVNEARKAIMQGVDEAPSMDDVWLKLECAKLEDEFDAVRRRLLQEESKGNTRRVSEVIEQRSKPRASFADARGEVGSYTDMERKENYSNDFGLSTQEVLEIPAALEDSRAKVIPAEEVSVETVNDDSAIHISRSELSIRLSVLERDIAMSPFRSNLNLVRSPEPVIQPLDSEWDCPSATIDRTLIESMSQISISPSQPDQPSLSASPAIFFDHPSEAENHNPLPPIPSFIFRSQQHLVSLLDGNLDIAARVCLESAATVPVDHRSSGVIEQETHSCSSFQCSRLESSSFPPSTPSNGEQNSALPELKIEPSGVLLETAETSVEGFLDTVTTGSNHPAALETVISGDIDPSFYGTGQIRNTRGLSRGRGITVLARPSRPQPMLSTAEECGDLTTLSKAVPSRKPFSKFKKRLAAILRAETAGPTQDSAPPTAKPFFAPGKDKRQLERDVSTRSSKIETSRAMAEHQDAHNVGLFSRTPSPSSTGKGGLARVTQKLKMLF